MWWESLSTFQQVMFVMAVTASAVMLIFVFLMLIGIDHSDFDGIDSPDLSVDTINDEPFSAIGGFKVLSVRSVLAFISIGAWAAFLSAKSMDIIWASLIGVFFGLVAAVLVAWAFKAIYKLESSGNLVYENSIGKLGTVYMRIPKQKSGKGKVTLVVQERLVEADAITEEEQDIIPKTQVEIIDVVDTTTLVVKKK